MSNRDDVVIFYKKLQVLFQGQWSFSLQFKHSTESGKYGIPWYNIEHWIPFWQKQEFLNPWQAVLLLMNLPFLTFVLSTTFR